MKVGDSLPVEAFRPKSSTSGHGLVEPINPSGTKKPSSNRRTIFLACSLACLEALHSGFLGALPPANVKLHASLYRLLGLLMGGRG